MTATTHTPVGDIREYPGDYCLKVQGAHGACILWPDHESLLCQDANGYTFTGTAITKRVGPNPFTTPPVEEPLVDMPRTVGEFDYRLDTLFSHQPTNGNPWASLARWGIRMGRIRRMVMDLHTQDGAK